MVDQRNTNSSCIICFSCILCVAGVVLLSSSILQIPDLLVNQRFQSFLLLCKFSEKSIQQILRKTSYRRSNIQTDVQIYGQASIQNRCYWRLTIDDITSLWIRMSSVASFHQESTLTKPLIHAGIKLSNFHENLSFLSNILLVLVVSDKLRPPAISLTFFHDNSIYRYLYLDKKQRIWF